MANVNRQRVLDRRTFLRGAGVAMALPWLDAMVPAMARVDDWRRAAPARFGFVFMPNGMIMDRWTPDGKGKLGKLSYILEPLARHRSALTVISGLDLDNARAKGDGPGDHARAAACFLTAAHPKKTGGSDIHNGVSIDQRLAQVIGQDSRFPSLELGMERGRSAGVCDSGYSCAYSNNISWRSPTTPVAKETQPRAVFARLFGDIDAAESRAARAERDRRRKSVLDFAREDAKKLRSKLGAGDRAKLDEYFDAVRALEKRLGRGGENEKTVTPPDSLKSGGARGFESRLDLMYEILALALQTDNTRVASFMLGNGGSGRNYRFIGVPKAHHNLSHHGKNKKAMAQLAKIGRFHMDAFGRFLDRLEATKEGDKTLLDRSLFVFGAGMGDPNRHNHDQLPYLLAGHGAGLVRGGRHLVAKKGTPAANLYLSLLRGVGAKDAAFGDSQGTLKGL